MRALDTFYIKTEDPRGELDLITNAVARIVSNLGMWRGEYVV